jgi:biopolymer transport protein ExbD
MKFGKLPVDQVEDVPFTPLIDIVFLTLIFFMLTAAYNTQEAEIGITLPTAAAAHVSDRTQGEIYINIRPDGEIVINERVIQPVELQDILKRVATYFPGGSVIIRGDRQAALGRAILVLDACRRADIQNVSFAAVPPEEPIAEP